MWVKITNPKQDVDRVWNKYKALWGALIWSLSWLDIILVTHQVLQEMSLERKKLRLEKVYSP